MNKRFVNGQQVDENGTPIAPKKTAAEQLPKDMNNPDSEGASEEQISEMFGAEKPNPSLDDEAGKGDITEAIKGQELKTPPAGPSEDLIDSRFEENQLENQDENVSEEVSYPSADENPIVTEGGGNAIKVNTSENTSKDEESSNEK